MSYSAQEFSEEHRSLELNPDRYGNGDRFEQGTMPISILTAILIKRGLK